MRFALLCFIFSCIAGSFCAAGADDGPIAIEWKENWDATYAANRQRWEKEIPPKGKKPDYTFQNRLIFLLESLIEKWPGEKAKRSAAYSELAELLTQINARGRACGILKKVIEESRGQPDAALQALLGIMRILPKYYDTDEARQWQEYAARRLIALNRVGYLSSNNPTYGDALECLLIVCSAQGRFLEASQTLELLKFQNRPDDRVKFQEAELYFRLGHIDQALRAYQELSFFKQDHQVQQRIAQLSSHRWTSTAQQEQAFSPEFDKKWQNIVPNLVDNFNEADALLRDDAEGRSIVTTGAPGSGRYASLWSAADEQLRQHTGKLGALRQAHAEDADTLLKAARKNGHLGEMLSIYRKFPWTQAAHDALIEYGERQLLLGHASTAARAFADVVQHANASELRGQAQVGLWLAMAQDSENLAELKRAASETPVEMMLPWKGKPTAVRVILAEILGGATVDEDAKTTVPGRSRHVALQLPAVMPWPAEMVDGIPPEFRSCLSWPGMELFSHEGRLLLSAPNLLICFGDDFNKPLWVHAPSRVVGIQGQLEASRAPFFYAPAPVRPAIGSSVVYTRWGLDSSRSYLSYLAAFDLQTGDALWSSEQDLAWRDISAIGDPAISDGMIYTLVIENGSSRSASALAISLVCMDAKTGGFRWKRHLANHQLTSLPQGDEREERGARGRGHDNQNYADVFHYGNAVAIHGGAVYCSTNCGVIARVDARDGVVEWLTTYSRTTPNARVMGLLRREGAVPLISGDRLVCIPRDYEGALGLNTDTGEIIWENPFAASQQAVALYNGTAIMCDNEYLVAIDAATGKLRWFRSFNGEIAARPIRDGSTVCVAAQKSLHRISIENGASVDETRFEKQSAPSVLAIHGDAIVSGSGNPARPFPFAETASQKIAPGQKLNLPLEQIWAVQRANPELIVPPERTGRVYLASEGLLECIDTASGKMLWQRFVSPGLVESAWTAKLLLLIYARHVEALDAESGEVRWSCATPFSPKHWLLAPTQFVFSDTDRIKQFGAIDLGTGAVLWNRRIDNFQGKDVPMIFEGGHIQLFGFREGEENTVLLLNPNDGTNAGTRPFFSKREPYPRAITMEGPRGALITERQTLHTISIEDGKPVLRYQADLKEAMRRTGSSADGRFNFWEWQPRKISLNGSWIDVEQSNGRAQKSAHWIFKQGDPDYMLRKRGRLIVQGDNLYYATEKSLCVLDLPTKSEIVRYNIPVAVSSDKAIRIVDFWKNGEAMCVVSGIERLSILAGFISPSGGIDDKPGELRIDVFDAQTGAHRQGQVFTDLAYWKVTWRKLDDNRDNYTEEGRGTQAVAAGGMLLVTDAQGLHAFASPAPDATAGRISERPLSVIHRHPTPIVADGSLQDWTDGATLQPSSNGQDIAGKLSIAHDSEKLYIAVIYNDSQLRPRRGFQELAIGDCLELGLETTAGSFRGCLSMDARGRCNWENAMGADKLAGTLAAGVRLDLSRGTHIYEMAIPLRALLRQDDPDWRKLGISAAIWKQESAGPRKLMEWGGGLAGQQMVSEAHARIYLDSATVQEEQAAWAVVQRFPELAASREFLQKAATIHGASRGDAATFLAERLNDHPTDASIETLLALFNEPFSDTELQSIAKAQHVSPQILERYSARASAYLSQWVYLDPARPPRMIMLQLNDGTSWEHRISWGDFEWPLLGTPGTPARRLGGPLPKAGAWLELRVPLVSLNLHDKPIHGISFAQHGGGRVCWDRTAIVAGGKETVLIDDALPEGTKEGDWEWTDEIKQSGAKSHYNRMPLSSDEALAHGIFALKQPIVEHLIKTGEPLPKTDSAQLMALLESEIPKMGNSAEAISFFQELLALENKDSEKVAQRFGWFLSKLPQQPGNSEILGQLLKHLNESKRPAAEDEVEVVIKSSKLPPQTAYDYRRKFVFNQHAFVRNWQVLGPYLDPLDNGYDAALPPEGKPVDIAAHLQAGDNVLNWSVLKSDRDYIDLSASLKPSEHAVAFAACWVQCDKARSAMLEIGADDACKVWVNQKPVHAHQNPRGAKAGDHRSRIFLTAGINEILVKVANSTGGWGFFFELTEPEGRGPLPGIKIFETPP